MIAALKEFVQETWQKFLLLFIVFFIAGIGLGMATEFSLLESEPPQIKIPTDNYKIDVIQTEENKNGNFSNRP